MAATITPPAVPSTPAAPRAKPTTTSACALPGGLGAYIDAAMSRWGVPGLVVSVVHHDAACVRGFGERRLGTGAAVDENTLFGIGSLTKGFTALLALIEQERGTVRLDAPIRRYLPELQLSDEVLAERLTLRDLLAHRSGFASYHGDAAWYGTRLARDDLLARLRFLEPRAGFRRYGYSNVMYLVAGMAIGAGSGLGYDDALRLRVLAPLGMHRTAVTFAGGPRDGNVAAPHIRDDGAPGASVITPPALVPVPWRDAHNIGPAGSMVSTGVDMVRYLRMLLSGGQIDDARLVSASAIREMLTPHTARPLAAEMERFLQAGEFNAYGLGWGLVDYRGFKIARHLGGLDGMTAAVAIVPAAHLGVAVLSNVSAYPDDLSSVIWYRILDRYLGLPLRDWSSDWLARNERILAERRDRDDRPEAVTPPEVVTAARLERYTGVYSHPLYGDLTITLTDDGLVLDRGPGLAGRLEVAEPGIFRIRWNDRRVRAASATRATFASAGVGGDTVAVELSFFDGAARFARSDRAR